MTAGRIGFGARRAPLQKIHCAFFERGGFARQMPENFAGEIERAGDGIEFGFARASINASLTIGVVE
jgi:hypothetical protein